MDKENTVKKIWLDAYDDHVPGLLEYPEITLDQLFKSATESYKNSVFIRYKEKAFSYQLIGEYVAKVRNFLVKIGIQKGDRVGLVMPNIPQFVIAYYGILSAGGVVVAMNPRYTGKELRQLINESDVSVIFCLYEHQEVLQPLLSEGVLRSIIITTVDDYRSLGNKPSIEKNQNNSIHLNEVLVEEIVILDEKKLEILPSDAAIFQFSGGTTGYPKAAIGMHKNIIANAIQFSKWCDLQPGKETILAAIPLYHVYGMVLALNMGIAIGAQIILIDDPTNIEYLLSQIDAHKATFYPGVPTMYHAINNNQNAQNQVYDLTSIKACISGSFTLHPKIKQEFERITGGKLVEGYGLSEAPTATHCNPLYGKNKEGSIGLPLPDVDAKIVDLKTGENELDIGQAGELVIRGPQVMLGYHNNIVETENTIRDGWLYTGDIATMDSEGYFFLVDRKKSLIKVNGLQVWPNEIEVVINAHPDIAESAAGGVPDIESGERIICWVVLKQGSSLKIENMRVWCKKSIASYKIPQQFIVVDKLPRTGVGKILRRELIADYIKKRLSQMNCTPKVGQ
jgi:long-chain acyl-CoA synthetase